MSSRTDSSLAMAPSAPSAPEPSRRAVPSQISIRTAADSDQAAWDRFVDDCSDGTFFHRYGWAGILAASFSYKPHFLIAEADGAIVGVLPLVHKQSALFGNALIGLPFCSYGGPLAHSASITEALVDHAVALAEDSNADYLELRGYARASEGWLRQGELYATFEQELASTPEAIIAAIPRKGRRHALRQSLKAGLSFEPRDELSDFYAVLSESYRNLGTPIFPKSYFENLLGAFPADFKAFVVCRAGTPVAASMAFMYRDHIHPLYAGGTQAARVLNANDFLFYNLMCTALEQGLGRFDFGRSKAGTGSFAYKKHWGFQPRFLDYAYKSVRGKPLPDLSPLNPRFKLLVSAWKRLPLPLSRAIGPRLVRHLG